MRRAAAAAAAALALVAGTLAAQDHVVITDLGPGPAGRILREALGRPHRLAGPDSQRLTIAREVVVRGSLIVLGRTARIEGTVNGDVIVVGGDLFVRPGARIDGRAIAIGGGTYPSALASVGGEQTSFRESSYSIARTSDGYELKYESLEADGAPPLLFPGVYGLRPPAYDRVNGLSLPFGPTFVTRERRVEADVLGTLRTNIGVFDPSLDVRVQFTRRLRATFTAQRASFSNEDWIWNDFVNSLSVLVLGEDTRNFYRADAGQVTLYRLWETSHGSFEPFMSARVERAWSAGSIAVATGGPWSVIGRSDSTAMWRPNPAISPGTVSSGQVGASWRWESDALAVSVGSGVEVALESPNDERFQRATADLAIDFPTFGDQRYSVDVHWVTTLGDAPPPQRMVYLGGPGTLPFDPMLSQGGDELLLVDQRYSIPLDGVTIGSFGHPTLQLRHRLASAGLGSLPALAQVVGLGLSLTVIRGEIQADPVDKRVRGTVGFTFAR